MDRARFAREFYHIDVKTEYYESGPISSEKFQVITLFHVLEHLPNPKAIIVNLINENLDENGLLIVEVPNLLSLQSKLAKNDWMHLDVPRHLSHFTIFQLEKLFDEIGMSIIGVEYFSKHLGIIGMLHALMSRFGYKGNIIVELKRKKINTLIYVILLLPISLFLEMISVLFKSGGIIRLYARKKKISRH